MSDVIGHYVYARDMARLIFGRVLFSPWEPWLWPWEPGYDRSGNGCTAAANPRPHAGTAPVVRRRGTPRRAPAVDRAPPGNTRPERPPAEAANAGAPGRRT